MTESAHFVHSQTKETKAKATVGMHKANEAPAHVSNVKQAWRIERRKVKISLIHIYPTICFVPSWYVVVPCNI